MSHLPKLPGWILHSILILWTSPNTILGLAIGGIGLLAGGRIRIRLGAVECYGGLAQQFVRRLPPGPSTVGITLGHVILGQTSEGLISVQNHERVHVRQYERWGPLFIPLYLWLSFQVWMQGKDAYRDNPFEVDAFKVSG